MFALLWATAGGSPAFGLQNTMTGPYSASPPFAVARVEVHSPGTELVVVVVKGVVVKGVVVKGVVVKGVVMPVMNQGNFLAMAGFVQSC